jgi:hypothetical protein
MVVTLLVGVACVTAARAQNSRDGEPPRRYGTHTDLDTYPQDNPQDTLKSVLLAIDRRRIDYLLAQLADPDWVDKRVRTVHDGKFDDMVKETTEQLAQDPTAVKQLGGFLKDGDWKEDGDRASAQLKGVKERVYFRKFGKRWYFENQQKPPVEAR